MSIEVRERSAPTGGVVARRGRPDLSPARPLCTAMVLVSSVSPRWEWGVAQRWCGW
ncbi:MAG: hypothetical protein ACJ8CB_36135 [Ktedonobacteraceae bacterium]